MAVAEHREPEALAAGLRAWLAHHHGTDDVALSTPTFATAGYSSEIAFVDASWTVDGQREEAALVVRLAPLGPGTHQAFDVAVQDAAARAAATVGVPVADPITTVTDPRWLGEPFTVLRRVDGHILGDAPAFDPWLGACDEARQAALHRSFLDVLARIHTVPAPAALGAGVPRRDAAAEVRHWRGYLAWATDDRPPPTLAAAFDWCEAHLPAEEPPHSLLWGDVRLGNVVFDDDGHPLAVLDWDMASVGAAEHDVAWLVALEELTAALAGARVPGFPDRAGTLAAYEARAGRALVDIEWFETLALARSASILTRLTLLRLAAGRRAGDPNDNPVLAHLAARLP